MVLRLNTVSYEFRSHLTVALSFAQFTGKGKNFTCNFTCSFYDFHALFPVGSATVKLILRKIFILDFFYLVEVLLFQILFHKSVFIKEKLIGEFMM